MTFIRGGFPIVGDTSPVRALFTAEEKRRILRTLDQFVFLINIEVEAGSMMALLIFPTASWRRQATPVTATVRTALV